MNSTRVYSPGQVALAALLGGPLAGCGLMRHNFRLFEKRKEARDALLWGVAGTGAILALAYGLPDRSPFTAFLRGLPPAYTFTLYQCAQRFQSDDIRRYQETGGLQGSWWAAAAVGLGWLVVLMGLILGVAFLR